MADLGNQKIKDTYQLVLQTDASGNLQNLSGGTPTLIISGQTTLTGGATEATPTPRIKFNDYYDNSGGPSVSHIDLYGGSYGFGITASDLDYTSDKNHRFYANGESTPGLTIDGDTKMVSINNAGTPAYNLDVTGDIRCTDDLFVNDDLVVDGFASLDSVRIGGTQTDPGTGNLYVEGNLTVNDNTLYVDSTSELTGVGTLQPTHKLTVSGGTSGDFTTYNLNGGSFTFVNGSNRLVFANGATTGELTLGDQIRATDDEPTTYTHTINAITDSTNATFIGEWEGQNITMATSGLLFDGGTNKELFVVYNGTGTTFQITGDTVMSGSTDLLNMFATSTQGGLADTAVQPADTFHIGTTSIAHNRGSGALTLAGLTLTTPVISSISNTGTVTLPTATDTLVGRTTTDTLTNKTLTNPTFTDPVLGQPDSGDLTNCTSYPEAALPSSINAIKIADGTVTSTEFQYINTLSSNAQTQLDAKQPTIESGARLNANLVGSGSVGDSEYGRLDGITANIQTQLYERLFLTGGTMSGDLVTSRNL